MSCRAISIIIMVGILFIIADKKAEIKPVPTTAIT